MFVEKDEGLYRRFLSLAVVLVLQNVVTLSVNLADNMMLGAYSETALAGVAAVNQIQFVYQQLLHALGDGVVIVGSQYWGKNQTVPMKRLASAAMRFGLVLSIALFAVVSLIPYRVMGIFTRDSGIIAEGARYLNIIRFTYLFFAVTQILLATLRSVETVKIAFKLSVLTLFVNCGINYVLINGHFGAPEMGVKGAAIGTLAARILECIVLLLYISKRERKLNLKWRDYLAWDRILTGDYLKVTIPMLTVQGLWGVNTALQTVILGHMTANAIAANSVASTLFLMVKSMAVGSAAATSVMIGKAVGSGDCDRAVSYARSLQRIFVLIGIVSGTLLFFIRIPVLSLYDLSAETREMANTFLIILSVVCVGMSYQMPTNNGIIRGGGNPMFVVKMDLISIWLIVIPVSLFMAFVVKASPVVVVCCLNADQIFKVVPAFLEVRYGNWMRKLTRD
ncbi:MATE family efflux transporter [Hungatella hathewayi]|jgi:putative MATE family efflux protein|uniref:Probable multidrug resistance protein NorM n=2 Tax=Hungatella hathewayi TaxID=154046 RepID=D3ARR2_9FIRM|nr:MATE family efflux transporter [Hungatella hathewayi]EFC95490.1 MATE efflux family protein [Hungatella hathewayi DSM 13479]MBS6758193.1 MATE family efflux transporter [Hungatella hathewayi]MBT9796407.1 MATE family efflux transporter [Hungatella hathewayi]RGZ04041.1 MATE family efflux transporter [Hungatella hathewayi]RHB70863.1 MATE family efflux transporter [Hungatella hathewayi]